MLTRAFFKAVTHILRSMDDAYIKLLGGETILIKDDIHVVVVGVQGKRVCLGIQAPQEISGHRSEIRERIQNEKKFKF
ncbi:MAG: csrA2 [Gammaproteobacteria bacterium]|jgi:carbon storage regulator|nr:csrA2 [Gammaproteobacteria bacterium]